MRYLRDKVLSNVDVTNDDEQGLKPLDNCNKDTMDDLQVLGYTPSTPPRSYSLGNDIDANEEYIHHVSVDTSSLGTQRWSTENENNRKDKGTESAVADDILATWLSLTSAVFRSINVLLMKTQNLEREVSFTGDLNDEKVEKKMQ